MNSITLSGPVADALGWTLVHAVWQGFAIVLPVAIFLHVLRSQSSEWRYRVGVAGLLVQVLVSAATFGWLYKPATAVSAVTMTGQAPQTLLVNWQTLPQTLSWPVQMQQFLAAHLSEFVLLYIIGVAVFVLRLAGGWLYLQRLSRTATIPASDRLDALVQSLRTVMQLGPVVRVLESARVAVPMVVGVLKPVLLLPVGMATHLSIQEVEAVLAHELAHVKRYDYAVNLLQSVMEVLYFFHPALWWLSARVREEREHCCDDLAVQTIGGNGRMLAQALAHVEELRLTQFTTPALAMALSNKRQLLLHRVRRVLGVPTRPFVSNGSLAGLTLATLLLLSASVYAVQQQPQPKAKIAPPTQRHKVDSNTEFGISDNKKLDYVIWKGQKLPASRVAKLQKLYDQVMAGQLNLDDVKQPDRDMLLEIIEVNYSPNKGTDEMNEGLNVDLNAQGSARIDYNTLMKTAFDAANSAGTFPVNVDEVLEKVEKIDYNAIIQGAFARIDTNIIIEGMATKPGSEAERDRQRAFHERQLDSLSQMIAQRSQQTQGLRLQMEKLRFPAEQLERAEQVLDWRKDKLMQQREALIDKHRQLLSSEGRSKLSQADTEKQLTTLELEIKRLETSLEAMNKELEENQAKQEAAEKSIEKLEQEMERLDSTVDKWSEQIGLHGDAVGRLIPPPPMAERGYSLRTPPRPARAPRPPKPAYGVGAVKPVAPAIPPVPRPARAPQPPKPVSGVEIAKPVAPPVPLVPAPKL